MMLGPHNIPVNMICVCSAGGELKPLRFQLPQPDQSLLRVDIDEILSARTVQHVGIESQIYHCRGTVEDRSQMFDLKYFIRTHRWYMVQPGATQSSRI